MLHRARALADEALVARRMRRSLRQWTRSRPAGEVPPLDDQPTTTVVVPCFNHAAHLPLAVQSLVEQSLASFDVVLIDDGSSDETNGLLTGLADRLAAKGAVTLLSHRTNRGQAATLNEAIGLAATPLVTVLNDDDWLMSDALAVLLANMTRHPDLALVGAGSRWFDGAGRPPLASYPHDSGVTRFEPGQVRAMRHPLELNMTHSGMTLRRAAWAAVGGYRVRGRDRVVPYSDRDLQLRIAALFPVAVVDAALVWWRSDSSVDAGLNS